MSTWVSALVSMVLAFVLGYQLNQPDPMPVPEPIDPEVVALKADLLTYEAKDFRANHERLAATLTETENGLVSQLLACFDEKDKMAKELAMTKQSKQVRKANAPQTFIERFLEQDDGKGNGRKMLPGKLSPSYSRMPEGQQPPPIRVVDARYRQIFPDNKGAGHAKEDAFGFVEEVVDNIDAFLDGNVTPNPGMTIVHKERKERSTFFNNLQKASFEGNVNIFTEAAKDKVFQGNLSFESPEQNGQGWLVIRDDQETVFETRTFSSQDEAIWRYNLAENAVSLMSDQCHWSDAFVHEFKDMFYLSQQNMLIGNIYCREQSAKQWSRIGTFSFEQVGF